jgi:hypothetical protein
MTVISMFEDSMQIAMDEGWFDMASLVAIARCNKQLCALVDRADHLWEPFLVDIKFAQTGFIDDSNWMSPNIPWVYIPDDPLLHDAVSDLRVPPRINGGRRDDHSFFVHPRDKEARGRGLVLANEPYSSSPPGIPTFDHTNGILKDLFHGENEVGEGVNCHCHPSIYIPRALLIECKACRVMLDSYPALVSHCKEWSHMQNVDEKDGLRVPEEFVDPRNTQSYHQHLSVFQKVMALKTFEHKFIAFLHAPLDQDGIINLMSHRRWVLERMWVDPDLDDADWEDLHPTITLQRVWEASIEFVLLDFDSDGNDRYSLDIILGGWQVFSPYGSGSENHLYSIITGLD